MKHENGDLESAMDDRFNILYGSMLIEAGKQRWVLIGIDRFNILYGSMLIEAVRKSRPLGRSCRFNILYGSMLIEAS